MKRILSYIFCLVPFFAFTQNKINYFKGDFDSAIEQAKTIDKDIFLITISESCQVSYIFRENIIQDTETVKFLRELLNFNSLLFS